MVVLESNLDAVSACQSQALLRISCAMARHQEFGPLIDELDVLLREVVKYDKLVFLIYDDDLDEGWLYYPGIHKEPFAKIGNFTFRDGPGFWAWMHQTSVRLSREDVARSFPKIVDRWRIQQVASSCTVPLTAARRRLGALEFLSRKPDAYSCEDVQFIELVAAQVAILLDNALVHDRVTVSEDTLARERDHFRMLLEITNAAVSQLDTQGLISEISAQITRATGAEFCGLVLPDHAQNQLRWEALHFPASRGFVKAGRLCSFSGPLVGWTLRSGKPRVVSFAQLKKLGAESELACLLLGEKIRSFCALPLTVKDAVIGVLTVGQLSRDCFDPQSVALLEEIARQISVSTANTIAYSQIKKFKDKTLLDSKPIEREADEPNSFPYIIGNSDKLRAVLEQVRLIAESSSQVLILGETGTGKELIARAIHNMSARRSHNLVKVNCCAIPTGLLESELFGHEKGAFTGAVCRKIGRFELAHQGTIFLDEIGDIPVELQSKLLRALQEHEFERLGSNRPIQVDVRIIAATNRDLEQMIADRQFRSDLYYRLNVFPIVVPPLRDRPEDIPLLVRHFVKKYASQMKRDIQVIPSETMATLMRMPWPGNIRELENHIERAVIMSPGQVLQMPPEPAKDGNGIPYGVAAAPESALLEDMERHHILRVLRETNGIIAGSHGAAVRLGLKRTTLLSMMQRLGIERTTGHA